MNFELLIGGSTKTNYLVPDTVNLYDNLDSRSALSFQLKMPSTASRPSVGQPVFLSNGTSDVYKDRSTEITNYNFVGTAENATESAWIGGQATNFWYAAQTTYIDFGGLPHDRILINEGYLTLQSGINPTTNQSQYVYHSRFGLYTTNNILINEYSNYRVSGDISMSLSSDSTGTIAVYLYGGAAASTLGLLNTMWTTTPTSKSTSFTFSLANTSYKYLDVVFRNSNCPGGISLSNLTFEEVSRPRVFGGTLDNYRETCYPFTNELQLACQCVDFTQMLGKRLVFKSYPSSGLGEYESVATTESFIGDGSNMVWALGYPVETTPAITVNGFAADVGAVGSASTHGYYYTPSSHLILANTSNSSPASTDTLSVVYTAIVGKYAYDCDIIKDINDNFFTGENINASKYVSTGKRIAELNFNYVPGNEAINTVCDVTGYGWYIDPWRYLHYFARTENNAPFDITSTSDNWRSLSIKRGRDKYRNKEYVLNSYGFLPTTETFTGDGFTRAWALSYPLYDQPVVKVDGYLATVGVLGVATSTYGYYWMRESNIIVGNSTNMALASTDTLTVQYLGLYPVVAVAQDGEEIDTRAALEQNSGIYEEVTGGNKTYISTEAVNYGNSILSKYGKPLDEIEFETDVDGLSAGMIIHVKIDNNELDDYYYLTSVSAVDVGMRFLRYHVTAVSGTDRGGWVSFFRDLTKSANAIYTEPYVNLVQTTLLKQTGNIKFKDSGVTVTITVLTIYYVDTAAVDTAMVT